MQTIFRPSDVPVPASSRYLEGRIFLITGATDGIGKHTATKLAQNGATVILHGRNQSKLDETTREIKAKTGNAHVIPLKSDFASLTEVRKLSDDIHQQFDHLDVLINNAGVLLESRQESAEGYEMTFAVNVLAPFLLTSLLLDLLRKGSASRILNVSSKAQADFIDFDDLQLEKSYNGRNAYEVSKMCEIMFTYEMAELLKDDVITVNCVHPGLVNTKLLHAFGLSTGVNADEADEEFNVATDPKLDGITGKFFVKGSETNSKPISYDVDARKRLWDILVDLTGANFDVGSCMWDPLRAFKMVVNVLK